MAPLSTLPFRALVGALSLLSIGGQRRLGRWLGRLAWYLRPAEVHTTLTNLALCFPDMDETARRALARQSLQHTAMLLTEAGALFLWSRVRWESLRVDAEGLDVLEGACAAGCGVLILVPHFGNWEYLALDLGRYGLTGLYERPRWRVLERYIREARNRGGANVLPIGREGLRDFYRALRDGGLNALLPDQVPARSAGVYADFFGVPALTMTFAHRLIRRTAPRVLLGAAVRCPGGFRVRYVEADPAVTDPDAVVSAAAMNRSIEALVRTDPAQYQWEYKRFRRPPPGRPNPYDDK